MINRKLSNAVSIFLATLITLSIMLFSCKPSSDGQETSGVTDLYVDAKKVATDTVGPNGGIISVRNSDSSLDGLTIEVPAGAYESSVEFTVYEAPVLDIELEEGINAISPMIIIENGGEYSNEIMRVKVPLEVPEEDFAMAFLYDPDNGKLEGIPTYPEDDSSLTFLTRHCSPFELLSIRRETLDTLNIPTDYSWTIHFWNLPNAGSIVAPGGYCHGMALTSLYFYKYQYSSALTAKYGWYGEHLFQDEYDNGSDANVESPGFWKDDKEPIQICSVANSLKMTEKGNSILNGYWEDATAIFGLDANRKGKINIDEKNFYLLAFSLFVTEEPQLISVWNRQSGDGHALICGAINKHTLFVVDPNIPWEFSEINYDKANSSFKPYVTARNQKDNLEGKFITYDYIAYSGQACFYDLGKLDRLWQDYEQKSLGRHFPSYSIVASDLNESGGVVARHVLDVGGDVTESGRMRFELDAPFEGRLKVYNRSLDELDSNYVNLSFGDNYLGFLVEASKDDYWWWAGFDWVNITCKEEESQKPADEDPCSIESLRSKCSRGVSGIRCSDGTCWRCVNGEPVQVECGDTSP